MIRTCLVAACTVICVATTVSVGASEPGELVVLTDRPLSDPIAAASADRFLLVWKEAAGESLVINGRIIDGDGHFATDVVPIARGLPWWTGPAIAGGHDEFLVAWVAGSSLLATRVTLDGAIRDPAGIVIFSTGAYIGSPRVVWNGTDWLAQWTVSTDDGSWVHARRIGADGVPKGPRTRLPGSSCRHLVWNGDRYFGLCNDYESDVTRLVSFSSELDDMEALPFDHPVTSLAPAGDGFAITYREGGGTWAAFLGDDGRVLETTRLRIADSPPSGPSRPSSSVAVAREDWLIVHERPGSFEPDVFLNDVRVFSAAWAPSITAASETALITALSPRGFIARVVPLDGPIPEATAAPYTPEPMPAMAPPILEPEIEFAEGWGTQVAASAEEFLVAWITPEWQLEGVIVDRRDGTTSERFIIGDAAYHFSIASDGEDFVAVWTWDHQLRATRIVEGGVVTTAGAVLWDNPLPWGFHAPLSPAVTWAADAWVVAWETTDEILLVRVTPDLVSGDPLFVDRGLRPKIAAYGANVVVTLGLVEIRSILVAPDGSKTANTLTFGWSETEDWDFAVHDGRALLAYYCRLECRESSAPSAVFDPRVWTVEIDMATGRAVEEVFVDGHRLLETAWRAQAAVIDDTALAVASAARGDRNVAVGRFMRRSDPGVIPVPHGESPSKAATGCALEGGPRTDLRVATTALAVAILTMPLALRRRRNASAEVT